MTHERNDLCPICELRLGNGPRRYLEGIPAHARCVRDLLRTVETQKRLIEAGETFASRRESGYRRGKGPGAYQ